MKEKKQESIYLFKYNVVTSDKHHNIYCDKIAKTIISDKNVVELWKEIREEEIANASDSFPIDSINLEDIKEFGV